VLAVGRAGSDECREAAYTLADAIAHERGFIHATGEDLRRNDADAYDRDSVLAAAAAAGEAGPSGDLARACSN
jgi:hypothetical protein